MKFLVASDNGNSEQKMFINGKRIQSPNVFARVQRLGNLDEVNPQYVLEHIHDNLIVTVEGRTYYIGDHALRSGQHCRSITVGVDNDKVSSDIVFVNTLAHIAAEAVCAAAKDAEEEGEQAISVNVDMATAIPVSYYTKAKGEQLARKFEQKRHTVGVFVGNREYTVFIAFDFVKVIPEGVTAAHALLASDTYFHETKEARANLRLLHIAIGEGTTEFPITTGIAFKPDFITGTNNGNGHAIARVLEDFKHEYGLSSITRQDFSRYVMDEAHKYHKAALDALLPALDDEAEDILVMAQQVMERANNEIDVVVVYGGGSILMRDVLEKKLQAFCDRARVSLCYIKDEEKAVLLEAEGLNTFVHSPLFETLKNRAMTA